MLRLPRLLGENYLTAAAFARSSDLGNRALDALLCRWSPMPVLSAPIPDRALRLRYFEGYPMHLYRFIAAVRLETVPLCRMVDSRTPHGTGANIHAAPFELETGVRRRCEGTRQPGLPGSGPQSSHVFSFRKHAKRLRHCSSENADGSIGRGRGSLRCPSS